MFRKLWLPIIIVVTAFVFIAVLSRTGLSTFIDIPSIAIVPVLSSLFTCLVFGASGIRTAFKAPFSANATKADLNTCLAFFRSLGMSSLVFGGIGTIMGTVAMMKNLEDKTQVGPNMAMALLTLLYAILVWSLLVLPFTMNARKRLAELE